LKKKLIEVALPLDAINKEAAREKSIRHGHPSTLHLWWARRPLAACRAVLFASLVDDPSSHPDKFPTEADQDRERQRLFRLLEELVKWENSNNRQILDAAHQDHLRPVLRRRLDSSRSPATRARSARQRPQSRRGVNHQGADRDPAQVR
jgi:putative DNA methylase